MTSLVTAAAVSAQCFVATGRCLPLSTEVPLGGTFRARAHDEVNGLAGDALGLLTAAGDLGDAVVTLACLSVGPVTTSATDETVRALRRASEDVGPPATQRDLLPCFHGRAAE